MRVDKRIAIKTDGEVQVTYGELRREVQKLSKEMECRQVAVIVCSNTLGCIYCYLACLKRKVVPLLLPENISGEQLGHCLDTYGAKYLCMPFEETVQAIRSKSKHLCKERAISIYDYMIYEREAASASVHKDLTLLLTTSGSTGGSRCVRLSRKNVIQNTRAICESLKIQSSDRAITSLPLNYTYGLSVLHTHLYRGATVLLTNKTVLSRDFWTFFDNEEGTSFAGVPFMYECLYKLGVFKERHKSLQVLTQAGGKLNLSLQKYYGELAEQYGYRFYIMYGQTEATARMSYLPYQEVLKRQGSVGVPICGGKFEIVSDEIVYYGDNVFMGYAEGKEELCLGDSNRGILHTGDLGYIKEGFLYVTGRKDRMIKINGVRISLPEFEEYFQQTFHQEMICIMKKDILYYVHEGSFSEGEWQKILLWTKEKLPILSGHLVDMPVKRISRTSSGKVNYVQLEHLCREK